MSTADADDVPDPLAGIDLDAWQPPAPPMGQVEAILARVKDGTRVDGAAAVELEPEVTRERPRRTRWVAIGIVVGAAAAALLMIALWPRDAVDPVTPGPVPGPIVIVTPGSGSGSDTVHPGGTVTTVDECTAFIAREDYDGLRTCSEKLPPAEALQVLELGIKANEIQMSFALVGVAVANNDLATAEARLAEIPDNSIYHQRAVDLVDGIRPVVQRPPHSHTPSSDCDSVALLDKARNAGAASQYSKMYALARASNACSENKKARQLALLAACRLSKQDAALELWPEFASSSSMQQVCSGVVDKPAPTGSSSGTGCDATALLDEARTAGSANQWSKVLSKAEASNKCQPSKPARQLALLAACNLGNRDKALRYWKEFENNTGMQNRCIGVVK